MNLDTTPTPALPLWWVRDESEEGANVYEGADAAEAWRAAAADFGEDPNADTPDTYTITRVSAADVSGLQDSIAELREQLAAPRGYNLERAAAAVMIERLARRLRVVGGTPLNLPNEVPGNSDAARQFLAAFGLSASGERVGGGS